MTELSFCNFGECFKTKLQFSGTEREKSCSAVPSVSTGTTSEIVVEEKLGFLGENGIRKESCVDPATEFAMKFHP